MKRAVFLDRDGVINRTVFRMGKARAPYTLEEFSFLDGVPEAIRELRAAGFLIVVVTNQPDVARGWVTRAAVDVVNDYVQKELRVDEIRCCFHTEKDQCECRKPKPGMLTGAALDHHIDLKHSFMIGDRYSDIEAGKAAGCRTLLVGAGDDGPMSEPDHRVISLLEGVPWILSH